MSDQGPAIGERRVFGDKIGEWDGQGWAPVGDEPPLPRMSKFGAVGGVTNESGAPVQHEPDTWLGGFARGLKQQFIDPVIPAMERSAQPQSVSDILPMLLPEVPGAVMTQGRNLGRNLRMIRDDAATLKHGGSGAITATVNAVKGRMADPMSAGERLLQSRPYLQMEDPALMSVGAPQSGRQSMPVLTQQGFNDLPLAQQQVYLQQFRSAPAPIGKASAPPVVDEVPFHQRPVHEQMRQLPENGPVPQGGRASSPPTQQETPFHQRPVYQQMQQLPENGPMPRGGRTSAPPLERTNIRQMVAEVKTRTLSEFDKGFIDSISERLKAGRELSEPQSTLLFKIYARTR